MVSGGHLKTNKRVEVAKFLYLQTMTLNIAVANCFIFAKAICAVVFVCLCVCGVGELCLQLCLKVKKKVFFLFKNKETRLDTWFRNDHVFAELKFAMMGTAQTLCMVDCK